MDLNDQFEIEHLYLNERVCRVCKKRKNLIDDFYRTRKKHVMASSYSYECKECTIERIQQSRKKLSSKIEWEYPDW
jgi:hypothetical protein